MLFFPFYATMRPLNRANPAIDLNLQTRQSTVEIIIEISYSLLIPATIVAR